MPNAVQRVLPQHPKMDRNSFQGYYDAIGRELRSRGFGDKCRFCANNGELWFVSTSHKLKDEQGRTRCPILQAYTCPKCRACGLNAHTKKYCPTNRR
ncbi:nanos homolog 2-like [Amphibalanus amphitrite]|uniref:nanos homolog 2-like n=1 Tax=Amphibalanus amphitrite TaxID=1232801 RepID=UPI001C913A62|nr:nanos homolog 2-like [Amphibalanus amphitrite]